MDFVVPFDQLGSSDPGPWTNAAPQSGVQGSIVNANVFPAVQNEILNVQDEAGETRDSTNNAQLLQAIRSGKLTYFADTGTADALVITPRTSLPSLAAGLELAILKGPQPNATTTPGISVGGLAATFVKESGAPLAIGDLPGNSLFTVRSDGTNLRVQGLRYSDGSPPQSSLWHVGTDTSTSAATITATVSPAVPTRVADFAYLIIPKNACAGATQINVGFGLEPLTRNDATPLQAGDYGAGQPLVVVDDGANFRLVDLTPSQVLALVIANLPTLAPSLSPARNASDYTTAGTYTFTVPSNVTWLFVRVVGGGGGGGGGGNGGSSVNPTNWAGAGGGAGGYAEGWVAVTPGQQYTVVVGAGGAGGAPTQGVYGSPGSTSSFGSIMSATGGGGGCAGSPGAGGLGGVGSGGQLAYAGAPGNDGNPTTYTGPGGIGGSSALGGGGRTATLGPTSSPPNSTPNGKSPGSGGGGIWGGVGGSANAGSTGGNGSAGAVLISY